VKHIRVELKLTAIVHVGEDVPGDGSAIAGGRVPDAIEFVELASVHPISEQDRPHRSAIAEIILTNILENTSPIIGARLDHALRKKGL